MKLTLFTTCLFLAAASVCFSFEDEKVVNAALKSFFKISAWNTPHWCSGDYIAVDSDWSDKVRPAFQSKLISAISDTTLHRSENSMYQILQRIRRRTGQESIHQTVEPLIPLKLLILDRRILVGAEPYEHDSKLVGWVSGEQRIKTSAGKIGFVRASGRLAPPSFSKSGHYAYVSFETSWSIHSAEIQFFLERRNNDWHVIVVHPVFFV